LSDSSTARRLLVVATLITLAVTLLRLLGEMARWSPALFNREAGGPGALVGIVWLIPVFGVFFGLHLARAGAGPQGVGKALGWAALGFVANLALGIASAVLFPKSPPAQLAIFAVGSWTGIVLARRGWPALWRLLLLYGFAARIPVVVVMFLAIFGGWDSHYAKPRPDFPPMGPWGLFAWTAVLPQMTIWIFLTVVGGIIFGALAVAVRRLVRGQDDASPTSAA
jgi:hypothetical protein